MRRRSDLPAFTLINAGGRRFISLTLIIFTAQSDSLPITNHAKVDKNSTEEEFVSFFKLGFRTEYWMLGMIKTNSIKK